MFDIFVEKILLLGFFCDIFIDFYEKLLIEFYKSVLIDLI